MTLNILLLDDDPVAGVLAERLLERLGYPAPVRETEAEPATTWHRFDVVLADVDTLEARYRKTFDAFMRDDPQLRARVILMSARDDDARFGEATVAARLTKPLALPALAQALSNIDAAGADESPRGVDAAHWRGLVDAFGRDGMKQLVNALTADLPHRRAQFAQARHEHDLASLRRWAHALRGACLQMGAQRLVAKATGVETEADAETALADGKRLLEDYTDLVTRLEGEIASLYSR